MSRKADVATPKLVGYRSIEYLADQFPLVIEKRFSQFKTDFENTRSQQAIERIGAKKEGVLRKHIIRPDGSYRDSVFYSIIDSEWETVKAHLQGLLDRR